VNTNRSGWLVEWRTCHGLVMHTQRVWGPPEAVQVATTDRNWWPTCAPWLLGPRGSEEQIAPPLRPWLPLGEHVSLVEPGTPREEAA
jgi:hypothetical protein